MRRPKLALVICMLLLLTGGLATSNATIEAQQSPPPDTTVLVETQIDNVAAGDVTLSASSLVLPPGAATLQVEFDGALLLLVETGEILVHSDRLIVGASREGDGSGASEQIYILAAGERAAIPEGARIRLVGAGTDPARLFILTLAPSRKTDPIGSSDGVARWPSNA